MRTNQKCKEEIDDDYKKEIVLPFCALSIFLSCNFSHLIRYSRVLDLRGRRFL
jgi:hypothetical protein